jgi:hypothetical protein
LQGHTSTFDKQLGQNHDEEYPFFNYFIHKTV